MSKLEPQNPLNDLTEPSAESLLRDAEAHIRRLEGVLQVAGIPVPPRQNVTRADILSMPPCVAPVPEIDNDKDWGC